MIYGTRSQNALMVNYISFCLLQSFIVNNHVTNGLSINFGDNEHHGSYRALSYIYARVKRAVKFDWQKDEDYSNEEAKDGAGDHSDDYGTSILWSSQEDPGILAKQQRHFEVDFKQTVTSTTITPSTTTQTPTKRPTKPDIRAILWDQGVEAQTIHYSRAPPKTSTSKRSRTIKTTVASFKTTPESQTTPESELEQLEGETIIKAALPSVKSISNKGTPQDHSAKVKVNSSEVSNKKQNKTMETSQPANVELSVNEDMIRTYTLGGNETYGIGKAKPKVITKILSQMESVEYSKESETITEESTEVNEEEVSEQKVIEDLSKRP